MQLILYSFALYFMKIENTIGPWLGKTSKMLSCLINEVFQREGLDLTREQWVLLLKLHQSHLVSQNQLAFITERDKTSLTRLIKTMERKDLIKRIVDTNDKRMKRVMLTAKGRSVFAKATPLMQQTIQNLQEGIGLPEIEQTIRTLQKLQQNIYKTTKHCSHHTKKDIS